VGIVDELIEDGVAQVAPPTRVERYNPQPDRIHFTYGLAARLIWQVTVMMVSAEAWRGNNTELTLATTAAASQRLRVISQPSQHRGSAAKDPFPSSLQ
jgi:hypothetical protein